MNATVTPPLDIVIFGGAGDLSWRKLLPALFMAHLHGRLVDDCRIIGVGRHEWGREQYVSFIDKTSRAHVDVEALQPEAWKSFLERLDFVSLDATVADGYRKLSAACQEGSIKVFYLATSPSIFTDIAHHLNTTGLIDAQSRVVLEKPLGHDLTSAQAINEAVARHFKESQIYRIDHYLGKETVQNLMVLRFGNAIYEPLWRAPYIKSVQITVAETVGVGTRAGFYDHTGAMRDMVQNHLLQLLCIVAMEPPISLDPDDVRDEKLKVLRSLRKLDLSDLRRDTVCGQYTEGVVDGERVKGYMQEADMPQMSQTETFVAIRAQVNNSRWAGVPFFLRTGKRMQKRRSEIIIEFSDPPFSIFSGQLAASHPNRLIITLQPEESIQLQMMAKEPGSGMKMQPVFLNLDLQSAFTERRAEAYERLLIDVIKGRLTHFMRRDELEAAWKWADPILQGWKQLNDKPKSYPAGSWGPAASSTLVARENAVWAEAG
ncbi:glucose-6-phosphate dehydrogenase [Polaromonas jejuensis]|uniref:Glucose-6-phosphate 1-dehydrogenase n=1 Tax=Polaromonas jejuensis TaxID=457502 RepID=A0ABW0QD79_9BURK|nr:glucose-6-phosphate dehydrogenase [Polaromonas jejuensis]